jgi:hypothetical protein
MIWRLTMNRLIAEVEAPRLLQRLPICGRAHRVHVRVPRLVRLISLDLFLERLLGQSLANCAPFPQS